MPGAVSVHPAELDKCAWLLRFVSHHSFAWFAAYRIPLGVIVMVLLATGVMEPV